MTADSALADLRYGFRMLRRTPLLSFVVVLTMGVGIGLTASMFSFMHGLMGRGLPIPDGDRLV